MSITANCLLRFMSYNQALILPSSIHPFLIPPSFPHPSILPFFIPPSIHPFLIPPSFPPPSILPSFLPCILYPSIYISQQCVVSQGVLVQSNPIHFIYIAQFKQPQGSQSAVQQDKKHTKKHHRSTIKDKGLNRRKVIKSNKKIKTK